MSKNNVNRSPVKKAVIPAAGLGSRLGQLSAITPKELLPLVNKPAINWILDEASDAGIEEVCLIISPSKEEQFEKFLSTYRTDMKIQIMIQRKPGGLGHALLIAERWVGNDPFVVLLPDDFILGENVVLTLLEAYQRSQLMVLTVVETRQSALSSYGVANVKPRQDDLLHVLDIIEKPPLGSAPSNLSIVGRYLLTNKIWASLHEEAISAVGEIQLTSSLQALSHDAQVIATLTQGERHDLGNQEGWLNANIAFSKWITDGSSPIAPKMNTNFAEFLVGTMLVTDSLELPNLTEGEVLQLKEVIEKKSASQEVESKKLPPISIQMWDNAFFDLVDLCKISKVKKNGKNQSLRILWQRLQSCPTEVNPFLILFESNLGISVVTGEERLQEYRDLGMTQIPAWIIRPLDFENPLARL